MAGGAVEERSDDELVGGWRGAFGVAAIVALFTLLAAANIWWFVFAVGVLVSVFLHEVGHFVTARWTGMKATQFFVGFGPRLWSFRRGGTEYGVRALPLGAFVRIVGMNSMDEVEPADEPYTYRDKSFPRRLLVISAGSIMHMLIAVVLLFSVYVTDGEPVVLDGAEVGSVIDGAPPSQQPVTGAALEAGVLPNDVIVAIDGQAIVDSADLRGTVQEYAAGEMVDIELLRGGHTAEDAESIMVTAQLGSSFMPSDTIVSVGDVQLDGATSVSEALASVDASDGDSIQIGLDRGVDSEGLRRAQFVPARVVDGELQPVALLGVSTGANNDVIEHGVVGAAVNSVTDLFPTAWKMTKGVVKVIDPVNVLTHVTGTNDDLETRPTTLIGVGGISDDVGESQGLAGMIYLLAILNVFVGVFNMFPLLPLDGGHAAIAVYERIRELMSGSRQRYHADVAKLLPLTMLVVTLLGFLFMSGLYLDITQPL